MFLDFKHGVSTMLKSALCSSIDDINCIFRYALSNCLPLYTRRQIKWRLATMSALPPPRSHEGLVMRDTRFPYAAGGATEFPRTDTQAGLRCCAVAPAGSKSDPVTGATHHFTTLVEDMERMISSDVRPTAGDSEGIPAGRLKGCREGVKIGSGA